MEQTVQDKYNMYAIDNRLFIVLVVIVTSFLISACEYVIYNNFIFVSLYFGHPCTLQ